MLKNILKQADILLQQPRNFPTQLLNTESFKAVNNIWDAQLLEALLHGEVAIPDSIINRYLSSNTPQDDDGKRLQVFAYDGNQVEIHAFSKKAGNIKLIG